MSAFTGPIIDVADKEDLLCAFHPEIPIPFGNGQSLGQGVVDTQSFNKTNASKYITSTDEGNDGYWGNVYRSNNDPVIISRGLSNQLQGVYSSFSGQKIHNPNTLNYTYTLQTPITNYFLNNSLTICGFFKVDKFPFISSKIKQRLGVVSVNYPGYTLDTPAYGTSGIGVHRIGVRKADDSDKFCISAQTNIFGSMAFSIFSDYVYDVGKWYFFSYRLGYTENTQFPEQSAFHPSLWVDGEPVTTYYANGINFFYKKDKDRARLNQGGDPLSLYFPSKVGFKNINGDTLQSEVSTPINSGWQGNVSSIGTTHTILPYGYIWTNARDWLVGGQPLKEKTDSELSLSFLHLPKYRKLGGYHDNISIGSHFVFKSSTPVTQLFKTYKSLYL